MIYQKIVIVGGGVAGVGTALKLAGEGYEVTLIEANELLSGSSRSTPGLNFC
jgi:glycine/D-amino acid oxidase-like deaminating enzyme